MRFALAARQNALPPKSRTLRASKIQIGASENSSDGYPKNVLRCQLGHPAELEAFFVNFWKTYSSPRIRQQTGNAAFCYGQPHIKKCGKQGVLAACRSLKLRRSLCLLARVQAHRGSSSGFRTDLDAMQQPSHPDFSHNILARTTIVFLRTERFPISVRCLQVVVS